MTLKYLSVLTFIAIIIGDTKSAKILAIFPMPAISHQIVFRPLTQELAKRGHEVTVITPNPAFPDGNYPDKFKEIDIHEVSYTAWQKYFQNNYKANSSTSVFDFFKQATKSLTKLFTIQLQAQEIQTVINDENNKYDLILIEPVIRPAIVFSYIFKAPVILVSSLGVLYNYHKAMGMQTHPLLYPSLIQTNIYNLTLMEKLKQIYIYYMTEYADYLNEIDENNALRNIFGENVPPISDLYRNIDMLFINSHPTWLENQPTPPNVCYISGIHILPEKELPKDLEYYLNSSERGVIYVSFGTSVLPKMIPLDKIRVIVDVLSKLPYDVLWKWDESKLPGQSSNIRLSNWYPQADLLRHPKVKLFITQAGLQSTDEAIAAGVPLVAIPMLGDQWYNAEKYVKYGIGKKLDLRTLTADDFQNAVETVIKDDSYRKNIIKLRDYRLDQPMSPLDSAVWWTEYVIRHGGAKHLRAAGANLSYAEYFEVEIVLIVTSFVMTVMFSLLYVIRFVIKCIQKRKSYKIKVKTN